MYAFGDEIEMYVKGLLHSTGTVIKMFPKHFPISEHDVVKYYEISKEHQHFKLVTRPCKFDRYVAKKVMDAI